MSNYDDRFKLAEEIMVLLKILHLIKKYFVLSKVEIVLIIPKLLMIHEK